MFFPPPLIFDMRKHRRMVFDVILFEEVEQLDLEPEPSERSRAAVADVSLLIGDR